MNIKNINKKNVIMLSCIIKRNQEFDLLNGFKVFFKDLVEIPKEYKSNENVNINYSYILNNAIVLKEQINNDKNYNSFLTKKEQDFKNEFVKFSNEYFNEIIPKLQKSLDNFKEVINSNLTENEKDVKINEELKKINQYLFSKKSFFKTKYLSFILVLFILFATTLPTSNLLFEKFKNLKNTSPIERIDEKQSLDIKVSFNDIFENDVNFVKLNSTNDLLNKETLMKFKEIKQDLLVKNNRLAFSNSIVIDLTNANESFSFDVYLKINEFLKNLGVKNIFFVGALKDQNIVGCYTVFLMRTQDNILTTIYLPANYTKTEFNEAFAEENLQHSKYLKVSDSVNFNKGPNLSH